MNNNEELISLNIKDLYEKLLEYKLVFIISLIPAVIFVLYGVNFRKRK